MRGDAAGEKRESRVLVFAGTTEGRELAALLSACAVPLTVSVATAYGTMVLPGLPGAEILQGRMDREEMEDVLRSREVSLCVDATHPFAREASREILAACAAAGVPCLRLRRGSDAPESAEGGPAPVFVSSLQEACAYLAARPGRILLTTGSRDLGRIAAAIPGAGKRCYARVLPTAQSLSACEQAGLCGRHVLAMQGPFSVRMNEALLRDLDAAFLLTKESGATGGYPEKLEAARACGVQAVVIRNPERAGALPQGCAAAGDFTQTLQELERRLCVDLSQGRRCRLSLCGAGPGSASLLTLECVRALREAQVVFGAGSVLRTLAGDPEGERLLSGKTTVPVYGAEAMLEYLGSHREISSAAALYSGDSGFYSGASAVLQEAQRRALPWLEVRRLPGISSVQAFAAALGLPWQEAQLASAHGRDFPAAGVLRVSRRLFLLVSGAEQVRRLGEELASAVREGSLPGTVTAAWGRDLSLGGQQIRRGSLSVLREAAEPGRYIVLLENPQACSESLLPHLGDDDFARGRVPMSKRSVRQLVLCALHPADGEVIWDVGAGTGSLSVEAARSCPRSVVWSIERKPEACALLRENRRRFALSGMRVVEGEAPQALEDLPAPSAVIIGGSSGELLEIVACALDKNPAARFVATAVTLETIAALMQLPGHLPVTEPSVLQVSAAQAQALGSYHLMRGENPVWIVSFAGEQKEG